MPQHSRRWRYQADLRMRKKVGDGWVITILLDHRPLRRHSQACREVPSEGSLPRSATRMEL